MPVRIGRKASSKTRPVHMCTECGENPARCQCEDEFDCADPHMCQKCEAECRLRHYADLAMDCGYPEY